MFGIEGPRAGMTCFTTSVTHRLPEKHQTKPIPRYQSSYCQLMSKGFPTTSETHNIYTFHYHSQKVIGCLGHENCSPTIFVPIFPKFFKTTRRLYNIFFWGAIFRSFSRGDKRASQKGAEVSGNPWL